MKVREPLSRSHNDLNTTDTTWLIASVHQLSCIIYVQKCRIFVFEISFVFYLFSFDCTWSKMYSKSVSDVGLLFLKRLRNDFKRGR
jgi:hypothetical protein